MIETVLLSPPYDFPPRPSLALSIFKACLSRDGITSITLYPMFRMSQLLGADTILSMYRMPPKAMFEEYMFSHLTGIKALDAVSDMDEYIDYVCSLKPGLLRGHVRECVRKGVDAAGQITEEVAREIVRISPKVLAVSSVFYQLNASLAIIRRVKELCPGIRTLIGGPNCMGDAGEAILRYFPGVDAVFFGEGDEVFSETIRALEDGASLPYGALRLADLERGKLSGDELPFRITKDMNTIPIPDYGDFMPYLSEITEDIAKLFFMGYGPDLNPVLLTEGSRGCWWGQKKPCSFCGLNGLKNVYRMRTSERIFEELITQYRRYDIRDFELTDNVIPSRFIGELLPLIEQSGIQFRFFAEVKPIFTEEEMFALRRAGFVNLQAGIETLNDHLLELLNKGGSLANNIRFLKCYRHTGIKAYWNMLLGIPGEQVEDYEEMLSLIPLLFHLQPPTGYTEVCFERRGAYVQDQERFNVKMVPMPGYRFLYGDNKDAIDMLAQHFEDVGEEAERMRIQTRPYYDRIVDLIRQWGREYWKKESCHLIMQDRTDYLVMTDTRPCAKMSMCFLKGMARALCLICDTPRSFAFLMEEMERSCGKVSEDEVMECIDYLTDNRYLVNVSGQYLTLAINM